MTRQELVLQAEQEKQNRLRAFDVMNRYRNDVVNFVLDNLEYNKENRLSDVDSYLMGQSDYFTLDVDEYSDVTRLERFLVWSGSDKTINICGLVV